MCMYVCMCVYASMHKCMCECEFSENKKKKWPIWKGVWICDADIWNGRPCECGCIKSRVKKYWAPLIYGKQEITVYQNPPKVSWDQAVYIVQSTWTCGWTYVTRSNGNHSSCLLCQWFERFFKNSWTWNLTWLHKSMHRERENCCWLLCTFMVNIQYVLRN